MRQTIRAADWSVFRDSDNIRLGLRFGLENWLLVAIANRVVQVSRGSDQAKYHPHIRDAKRNRTKKR